MGPRPTVRFAPASSGSSPTADRRLEPGAVIGWSFTNSAHARDRVGLATFHVRQSESGQPSVPRWRRPLAPPLRHGWSDPADMLRERPSEPRACRSPLERAGLSSGPESPNWKVSQTHWEWTEALRGSKRSARKVKSTSISSRLRTARKWVLPRPGRPKARPPQVFDVTLNAI